MEDLRLSDIARTVLKTCAEKATTEATLQRYVTAVWSHPESEIRLAQVGSAGHFCEIQPGELLLGPLLHSPHFNASEMSEMGWEPE